MTLHYGNPTALIAWAIKVGRIPAADSAVWLARLTGDGADAYAEQLVGPGNLSGFGNRTIPPFDS